MKKNPYVIALLCLLSAALDAAQITVDTDEFSPSNNGNCAFTEAILSASFDLAFDQCVAGAGDDVINFVPVLFDNPVNSLVLNVTEAIPVFQDSLDIQVPAGKSLSLLGTQQDRLLDVALNPGKHFTLNNTLLSMGQASTPGGAMQFSGQASQINLTGVVFTNNHSDADGGAIGFARNTAVNTQLNITAADFNHNSSGDRGGAIFTSEQVTLNLTASQLSFNSALSSGGALRLSHDAHIDDVWFEQNVASAGGAVYSDERDLSLTNSVLTHNQATGAGGAVYKSAPFNETQDSLIMHRNSVLHNSATGTAGVVLFYVNLDASNNLIAHNASTEKVGGLQLFLLNANDGDHQVHLVGNTFYHNTSEGADASAAGDLDVFFSAGQSSFYGNAVISTEQTNFIALCDLNRTNQVNAQHNLSNLSTGCLIGSDNQILAAANTEPQATSAGLHPTEIVPLPGSPLIDAWAGADCVDPNGMDIDLDLTGDRRLFGVIYDGDADGQRDCDIGATEVYEAALIDVTVIGSGAVSSQPAGLSCTDQCSQAFAIGTELTLTAAPSLGQVFVGWGGDECSGTDPCSFTVSETSSVVAEFQAEPTHVVTVEKTGAGQATVTSSPSAIDCGNLCAGNFPSFSAVTLTANPAPGHVLVGWTGCMGNGNQCVIPVLTEDTTVTLEIDDPDVIFISNFEDDP
ncbi:InlB B-repeat-containing protein [Marinicella meishanensis]|uniref:InlB B-repeat-containing protein n=1 Tax=Marinicella meishanensis TaxID=2873263 RepID=UPI001CBAEF02|nr:hypothetical protein [Marinicella sp. NBU2979]